MATVSIFCGVRLPLIDAVQAVNKHLLMAKQEPINVQDDDFIDGEPHDHLKAGLVVRVDSTNFDDRRCLSNVEDLFAFVGFDVAEAPSELNKAGQCIPAFTLVSQSSRFRRKTRVLEKIFGTNSWSIYFESVYW